MLTSCDLFAMFSFASRHLHVNCICLDVLAAQSDTLIFGFMTLNENVDSYLYNTWIIIILSLSLSIFPRLHCQKQQSNVIKQNSL